MKKKEFNKITKRNTHKRRSKEAARCELMKAVRESGVAYDGVKIKDITDTGRSGFGDGYRSENIHVRGLYRGSKGNFGFVTPDDGGEDVFIPGGNSLGAIDGDIVDIVYHRYRNASGENKTEGRVKRIVEIGRRTIIGTLSEELTRYGRRYLRSLYILPDDPKIMLTPIVSFIGDARVGDKVEVLIRRDGSSRPMCDIIRVFGDTESKEANYYAILAEYSIPTEFTPEELDEADRLALEPISYEGREDLTGEVIFTIDGEGAKDLDDAISLRRVKGGWRLGVHIADVSHYVRERTPLDRCVMSRGTSVYFTDKVVPMLPESLSNGACSLNAGEEKYAISAFITLDNDGEIKSLDLKKSVIKSRVRGVYSEINRLILGEKDNELKKKYVAVFPTIERSVELYKILLKKSKKRGMLDFDSDDALIILNEDGTPSGVERRVIGVSERIIEQFMLTANEAVATFLRERNIPCVYRIHELPPKDNYDSLLDYLDSLGFDVREYRRLEPDAGRLSSLLEEANRRGLGEAVSYTMLRAMSKARYSEVRAPHFGLGIENYCHFTSPIRRLSDLATHRIINKVVFEGKRPELYASYARRAAAAATEGELRALGAERRIEDLYKAIYMSSHIGDVFSAVVTSITGFGMFCTLENTCEGLVPLGDLDGVYSFDERNLILRSRHHIYRIADRIFVKLEEADITRGKLRFSVAKVDK